MNRRTAEGAVDAHQAMRDAQDRRFDREGVPMVLALFDERVGDRALPAVPAASVRHEGARYADIAGDFARALFPQARDADLASSIVVLQAMAFSRFAPAGATVRIDDAAEPPVGSGR